MLCPMETRLRQLRPRTFQFLTFLVTVAEMLSHPRPTHGTGPSRKLSTDASLRRSILCEFVSQCSRRDTPRMGEKDMICDALLRLKHSSLRSEVAPTVESIM